MKCSGNPRSHTGIHEGSILVKSVKFSGFPRGLRGGCSESQILVVLS